MTADNDSNLPIVFVPAGFSDDMYDVEISRDLNDHFADL
jgi:hypothetical protein